MALFRSSELLCNRRVVLNVESEFERNATITINLSMRTSYATEILFERMGLQLQLEASSIPDHASI